jgi:hypothetical protein
MADNVLQIIHRVAIMVKSESSTYSATGIAKIHTYLSTLFSADHGFQYFHQLISPCYHTFVVYNCLNSGIFQVFIHENGPEQSSYNIWDRNATRIIDQKQVRDTDESRQAMYADAVKYGVFPN